MNNNGLNFLIRSLIIFFVFSVIIYIRGKLSKPKVENNEQKPGKLQRIALGVLVAITFIFALMAVLGLVMKEFEMAVVSLVLTLLMVGVTIYLKSALKTSYQENKDFLILKAKNKENKVFYEDIMDWDTRTNEIILYDQSNVEEKSIKINVVFFKPVILLRKIADMTFEGKFQNTNKNSHKDANREKEIVNFLVSHQYCYLIEDYVEMIKRKKKDF